MNNRSDRFFLSRVVVLSFLLKQKTKIHQYDVAHHADHGFSHHSKRPAGKQSEPDLM